MADSRMEMSTFDRPDRLFVATEPPYYSAVIVWRRGPHRRPEYLVLHSRECPPEFDGDWSWGPPKGSRLPGETSVACAQRELEEETGLRPTLRPLFRDDVCEGYVAEVDADATIVLSDEHDRYEWVDLDTARRRCRPETIAEMFRLDLPA